MRRHRVARLIPLLPAALLLVLAAPHAWAQQAGLAAGATSGKKPLVILTQMWSPPNDAVAGKLASTITQSVDLVLRLSGSVTVERADFLDPTISLERSVKYYRLVRADGAVYGSITPAADGRYAVNLEVWSSGSAAKASAVHATISNLLSSFDLADKLALQVGSTVVGRKLSEGTLVVEGTAKLPSYSVYADGHLLGRDRSTFQVLSGEREIVVAKPGAVGDVPVEFFRVAIEQGKTTKITLSAVSAAATGSGAVLPTRASQSKAAVSSASPEAQHLVVEAGDLNLRYTGATGIFGRPALTYGSRTYALASKGEYAYAIALLSNLPGLTPAIQQRLEDAKKVLSQAQKRRAALGVLSGLAAGGLGTAAYALVRPNPTVLGAGLVVGIASLAAAIPTRMLESDSNDQINADISSAITEYEALPAAVRNQGTQQTYFNPQYALSGTQGENDWYYGYNGAGAHARFELMPDFHPDTSSTPSWWADYQTSWADINPYGMEAGSPKGGASPVSQNAVLRFVVPASGVYRIEATFYRQVDHGTPSVALSLRKNDSVVWTRAMSTSDTAPHNEVRTLSCRRGDTLDFVASAADFQGWAWIQTNISVSRVR